MGDPLDVLFVEDCEVDAELLTHALVRGGFALRSRRVDTRAGLDTALRERPDVVISDWGLPDMTALDVLAIVAARPAAPPVIVVSGMLDDESCVAAIRHGADDYLLKDRLNRLGDSLRAALERDRLAAAAERARRDQQLTAGLLRGLVSHAPAAIGLHTPTGRRLLSNRSFDRIGAPPAPAEVWSGRSAVREEHLAGRTYLAVHYPVRDEDDTLVAAGAIYLDTTEQRLATAELERARAELQHRADALREHNESLRRIDELKDRLVATVSHELRTPLTSICGYAELLQEGELGELGAEAARAVAVLGRNAARLLSLVDSLLLLARVDDGSFAPRPVPLDTAALVADVLAAVGPAAAEAGVQLGGDTDQAPATLVADRDQTERLLLNLLSNAVKFSRPGGTVRVGVGEERRDGVPWVVIAVSDDGIGISPQELPRLFSRFFRTEEAGRNEIQGTGLGLAVCREIARAHGGEIDVVSAVGRGSTFTVRLPQPRPDD